MSLEACAQLNGEDRHRSPLGAELAGLDAFQEGPEFVTAKEENGAIGVLAVANRDPLGLAGDLDTRRDDPARIAVAGLHEVRIHNRERETLLCLSCHWFFPPFSQDWLPERLDNTIFIIQ